ncbi:hypothetical protein [uncultured Desulfosarcina sp.]|uniref:5'-methylthioadenosine/S-adenosylhomocysteine nucleosidase family protein n=1 Tax=uncultured Desulfosarcina sp. TaxID=218289 RepID=UPI0029C82C38|nr:hypothetical protein [uncultured Desulfosarcina sp.]
MEKRTFKEDPEVSCKSLVYRIKEEQRLKQKNLFYRDLQSKSRNLSKDIRKRLFLDILPSFMPSNSKEIIELFRNTKPEKKHKVDVLVVTIKIPELFAAKIAFDIDKDLPENYEVDGLRIWEKTIDSQNDGKISIGLTMIGSAGNVTCARACSKLFSVIDCKLCILIGICAGLKSKVKIGDVIAADMILDYESGRKTQKKFEKRPNAYRLDTFMERSLSYFHPDSLNWQNYVSGKVDELNQVIKTKRIKSWFPNYLHGIILSGEKLIVDGTLPSMQKEYHEQTRAAEMEGSGFASICKEFNMPWLIFRGVSDFGDSKKSTTKDLQPLAALSAATIAKYYLMSTHRKTDEDKKF